MTHPDPFSIRAMLGPGAAVCRRAVTGEHGISLPPLHDHHVHAHLIDLSALPTAGIAAAVDLGGDPSHLAQRSPARMPRLAYAGAFLTAPGGYPHGRGWAPEGIVREVVGHADLGTSTGVETAIDEQAAFGASVIKVALNAAAGPVLDAPALRRLVTAAHERGLPVVAHAEGPGMVELAVRCGVDALAHTPFSELLDDRALSGAVGLVWISTLAIHEAPSPDLDRALTNAEAFVAAGGRLIYGTDLGNGEQRLGVSIPELTALHEVGLRGPALVRSLTDPWPHAAGPHGVSTFIPGASPHGEADIPQWLGGAVVVPQEELVHDD